MTNTGSLARRPADTNDASPLADMSIGFGVVIRHSGLLGPDGDLAKLAADDQVGRQLADAASTPKRRTGGR